MLQAFMRQIKVRNRTKNTMISLEQSLTKAQNRLGKPLEDLTWEELLSYIKSLKESGLLDSSISLVESKLIQFYTFCFDETDDVKYNKLVKRLRGINVNRPKTHISPENLLLPEDVKRLINVATLERDRCLVASFFESGMRKGEIISIPNSNVLMDEARKEVTFIIPNEEGCKTGGRTIVCTEIYGYVQDWMKCNTSDMFMPLSESGIRDVLIRLFKRASIDKPCNPHIFRHSAITHWVNIKMQPNIISMRAWGISNSNMLSVYVSLSEQMQAEAYRNAKGLNGNSVTVINPLASRCVECGTLIQLGNLCKRCENYAELKQKYQLLESKMVGIMQALDNGTVIPAGSFKPILRKE